MSGAPHCAPIYVVLQAPIKLCFPRVLKPGLTVPRFQTYLSTSNPLKMEYKLHGLDVIRETEDIGEAHDSTTLLNSSGGEPPTRNNRIVSEAYNASISSRRSSNNHSEDD